MININKVTAEIEENSIWITINIFSDKNQKTFTNIELSLSGDTDQSVILQEKLVYGDNIIESMFMTDIYPWFPAGCGERNVYEINTKAKYLNETSEYLTFTHSGVIDYTFGKLRVYDYFPQIFGISSNYLSIPKLNIFSKAGINTVFSNDARQEITDFCILRGIVLLPFECPNCEIHQIESFRKNNKKIILNDIPEKDIYSLNKLFSPIYVGNDFICNNTNSYINGKIIQGIMNSKTQEKNIINTTEIILEEFSKKEINSVPIPKDDEIGFSCFYCGENIIAKKLIIGKDVHSQGENIILSRFQLTENIWEIVFGANEFIQNLHIDTEHEISDNDFSLFPGESVHITFYGVKDNPEFKLTTK